MLRHPKCGGGGGIAQEKYKSEEQVALEVARKLFAWMHASDEESCIQLEKAVIELLVNNKLGPDWLNLLADKVSEVRKEMYRADRGKS